MKSYRCCDNCLFWEDNCYCAVRQEQTEAGDHCPEFDGGVTESPPRMKKIKKKRRFE